MSFNLAPYFNLAQHSNGWKECAKYKNIPIGRLEETKAILKQSGRKFRIRYRGTRSHQFDTRPNYRRNQDCLKRFADRFSVYYI